MPSVGAIGRQVALQVAAMGVPWLQLIDFDLVEPSNLASQGYLEEDLTKPKVEATGELLRRLRLLLRHRGEVALQVEADAFSSPSATRMKCTRSASMAAA